MRILIAEDDNVVADGIIRALRSNSYAVDWVRSGTEADAALKHHPDTYDLVILDIGLPGMEGFEVLSRLRARKCKTPVLILTARELIDDRIRGLDLGADDYLGKPFHLVELEARVRALLRRSFGNPQPSLIIGDLEYDIAGRRVSVRGKPVELSAREHAVFEILALHAGRVVSKEQILQHLCDWNEEVSNNAVEVYVHRVRKTLESSGVSIRTIRGLGYLLQQDE